MSHIVINEINCATIEQVRALSPVRSNLFAENVIILEVVNR